MKLIPSNISMTQVGFGNTSSYHSIPSLAEFAKTAHGNVRKVLEHDNCFDYLLTRSSTIEEAKMLQYEFIEILQECGFIYTRDFKHVNTEHFLQSALAA